MKKYKILIIVLSIGIVAICAVFAAFHFGVIEISEDLSIEEKTNKIKRYMTEEEVIEIMGDDFAEYKYGNNGKYYIVWVNEDDTEGTEVYFDDEGDVELTAYYDADDWARNTGKKTQSEQSGNQTNENKQLDDDEKDEDKEELLDVLSIGKKPGSDLIGGYEFGVFDKFNSPASENGLGGTKIYVYGECTAVFESDATIACYVVNDSDKWMVTLWDTDKLGEKDFSFLEGQEIYAFGEYLGYSGTFESPAMHFDTILCNGESFDFKWLALGGALDTVFETEEPASTEEPADTEATKDTSGKVSYDMFIERFDESIKKLVGDEYEFVEIEPNKLQYIWEKDGEEVAGIRLVLEDGYIIEAYYITATENHALEALFVQTSFEIGMFDEIPPRENGEYDRFGSYDVVCDIDYIEKSIIMVYSE